MADAEDGMDDVLKEALDMFELCEATESDNRALALDDVRFARLGEQWDPVQERQRLDAGRPCQTANVLPPFIRQVVNDARHNRPAIKVHPASDGADQAVAEIFNGLIRNIEVSSDADVAYDTALEHAVDRGVGYFRINTRYSDDDSFQQDLCIEAVVDPMNVYRDPFSMKADSADWNTAFVVEAVKKEDFKRRWKGADSVDWDSMFAGLGATWASDDTVQVAEYWKREETKREIIALSDGTVVDVKELEKNLALFQAAGVQVVGQPRAVPSHKVTQYLMSGAEVLDTVEWAGRYIPIVPVYGETVVVDGRMHLRSLIRDSKDSQRNKNWARSLAVETVALAPKAPFIGAAGAFATDADKWDTANTANHSFIEYDPVAGAAPPQRQPVAAVPTGAMQMANDADADLKAIIGMHEASLGADSGAEQSGRAILARMREGDVSTFHFVDNLSRSIRHAGRILIDLIPQVYSTPRIIRVMGPGGEPASVPINQPAIQVQSQASAGPGQAPSPQWQPKPAAGQLAPPGAVAGPPDPTDPTQQPQVLEKVFDLSVGKYDLTVTAGPSYTTRREEAAGQMIELIRAFPAAAPVLGGLLAKNLDWEDAEQVAEALKPLAPQGGGNPGAEMEAQMQAKQQQAQMDQQLAMQKLQNDTDLQRAKLAATIQLQREKFQQEMALKREQAAEEARLAEETSRAGAIIKLTEAANHQDQTTELPTWTIGGGLG